jgi:biotin transport system substrate-specific component
VWPVVLGVLGVVLCARVTFPVPGSAVPQSAQTLGVLVVGALLGARNGTLALAGYLVLGGVGLPVFADGASGWAHLVGPTAGYLAAFVLVAGAVGRAAELGHLRRSGRAVAVMFGGHVVILALGWSRLAWTMGAYRAYEVGVAPFLVGGIMKSLTAAAIAWLAGRIVGWHSHSPFAGGGPNSASLRS